MVYTLDSSGPLTKTLGLAGEFFNYEIDGTTFLGPLDPGLNSNYINSWNPLMVSGYCWLVLINFHIGQFLFICVYVCVCLCVCLSVRVCACARACVCLIPQVQGLLFQHSQISWSGRNGSFKSQQINNKAYFCSLFIYLYFGEYFQLISILTHIGDICPSLFYPAPLEHAS